MLAADQTDRAEATAPTFCWSCGVPDPGGDPCAACGASTRPKTLSRSELIGATASVRQKLKNRSGIVVAETPTSTLIALPDASVTEAPKEKLTGVVNSSNGFRSTAWTLVNASRAIRPGDRQKFDELITSFVLTLIDRSVDEARGFALDALDADCPAWLEKIHLTTTERDFLFASYHADRGNTAAALDRLLRLPPDRYPTKDLVFLRCIGAIQADVTAHEGVHKQLQPFENRPIAQALLSALDGGDLPDDTWLRSASIVLQKAGLSDDHRFPRSVASGFLEAVRAGRSLPDGNRELGPEARVFALAHAVRSAGSAPEVTLTEVQDAPGSLIDEAIELGVLTVEPKERQHPFAKYVLARTDPDVLAHDDLVELHYDTELARRAFLHNDRATLDGLPSSRTTDQLKVLDGLRSGDFHLVLERLDSFEGQARSKVESIARSLEQASIEAASNEVLTDGTTWPILAALLPEDTSALNSLSAERPALRGIATWRALAGAVSRLWDWDWEGAAVEAKRCLLLARDEHTRDEALNLIACAEWQLGDDADAIAALSTALEGTYTEGLQVNIGVVAAALEPRLAGQHLGKLAAQAPTLGMRAAAASRALDLWYADPDPWDTEEGEHALPAELRDALRQLVRSDVAETAFVRFVKTMSRWDEDWLAAEDSLAGSPFEGSPVASVYQAKARDFESFVNVLVGVLAQDDAPEWASEERDSLVGSAIAALDPEDPNPMAASFGLLLIDNGLPMDAGVYIDLVAFTIVAVCGGIDPAEGEPKERFLDMVEQARSKVPGVAQDEQERSGKVLDFAASTVVHSIAAARANQYDQVVELFNDLSMRLRGVPNSHVNRGAIRSGTQAAVDFLADTARMLERLIAQVPDVEFRQQVTEFRDHVRQLLTAFNRLRGS
jgi:hypothetical protein